MTRIISAPLVTLLVGLAPLPRADAVAPSGPPPRPAAQLSESEAIQIAKDEAARLKVDLEHFDPPSATYIADAHSGKWHIFFVAKSNYVDNCFFVDIYSRGERPRFYWCS